MRIVKLTARTEKWLLACRAQRDDEAHSVAATIVADVRKRGDSALFAWTRNWMSWISRALVSGFQRKKSAPPKRR